MSNPAIVAHPAARDYVMLVVLAAIWGASFMFQKIVLVTMPAFAMTIVRLSLAAVLMWGLSRVMGQRMPKGRRTWALIVLASFLGNAVPFTLVSWGQERVDAGVAAVLMGVMPLATLLAAHVFTHDEKLGARKLAGIGLGLLGLVILIGPAKLIALGDESVRQLSIATAATSFGIASVVTRRLMGEQPLGLAAAMLIVAAVLVLPLYAFLDGPGDLKPSPTAMAAIAVLAIFQTGLGTLMMFSLVARQGASFFSQINFLVPVSGVLWGALLLSEHVSLKEFAALAVILAGIAVARMRVTPVPGPATSPRSQTDG